MSNIETRNLARRIRNLERQALASKQPTLGFSTIDDGTLTAVDVDGNLVMMIGNQFDGTYTSSSVTGPNPPTPSIPEVQGVEGGVLITWDGLYADPDDVSPMDWARVDVVISDAASDDFIATPPKAAFVSPRGGSFFYKTSDLNEVFVALVARSQSGKHSDPSVIGSSFPLPIELAPTDDEVPDKPVATTRPFAIAALEVVVVPPDENAVGGSQDDDMVYEYYIWEGPSVGAYDATSLAVSSPVATARIANLPDGTKLTPLIEYTTAVIARDGDGPSAASDPMITTPRAASNDEISAEYGYFGDIEANQIKSGFLDAVIALVGRLDLDGGSWIDRTGIHILNPDTGEEVITLPSNSDLAQILADLYATSLTVYDKLTIQGSINEISKASRLLLAGGTSAPGSPLSTLISWEQIDTGITTSDGPSTYGLVNRSTFWVSTFALFGASQLISLDATTGARTVLADLADGFHAVGGVTYLGGKYYVLGRIFDPGDADDGKWYVLKLNGTTFVEESRWRWGSFVGFTQPDWDPAIGNDGTKLLISRTVGIDLLISEYNTDGTGGVAHTCTGVSLSSPIRSVQYGTFDLGGSYYIVQPESASPVVLTTSYAASSTRSWPLAESRPVRGLGWDGSAFWSLERDRGTLHKYNPNAVWTSSADGTWWPAYAWFDSDTAGTGTGPSAPHAGDTTGQHETPISPRKKVTMTKRAWLTVTAPSIPDAGGNDDPDSVRFYLAKGSTDPGSSGMYRVATPSAGTRSYKFTAAPPTSGTNPPTSNNFPAATPAKIVNKASETLIDGDDTPKATSTTAATFTANGSTPAGSTCSLIMEDRGDRVTFEVTVTWSSTIGTAPYEITVPWLFATRYARFDATIRSASATYPVIAEVNDSGMAKLLIRRWPGADGTLVNVSATTPVTIASGFTLVVTGTAFKQ